jgi:2-polyprenyl-3-methyl-5-hydroxy-6-metoxy-1,4-benzoquinol methylase
MMINNMIQNSPFRGQAIDQETGKVIDIVDFVGKFAVEDWGTISIDRLNNNTRTFTIDEGDLYVVVQECDEDNGGIGSGCWLSSIAMLAWLSNNKGKLQEKSILEMGCGVGLCSLALSQMVVSSAITASDYKVALAKAFDNNIAHNVCHVTPSFTVLNWNDCHKKTFTNNVYDLIIASDCIYKSTATIFKTSVMKLLAPGGTLIFINPLERSRPGVDAFIYTLAELGTINVQHINVCMNGKHNITLMYVEFQA